ncbi:MAG: efflux RND transporter periplasmic adaptor subunit [Alphaproteobacteria bacterium]|nr:efflux RND transporter periplasmic adaptor subunit [Alphaproteobacteria bacterium]
MTMADARARRPWVRCLAFVPILFGLLLSGCDDGKKAVATASAEPVAVLVAPVTRKDVTPSTTFVGRVEAIESVVLVARVEGFLESRNFDEGKHVKAGELLFQIERAPYEAAVKGRKADLMSAEATLKNARAELERARALAKRGNISKASVDAAEAEEGRAEAAKLQAEAALKQAEIDLGYTRIDAPISGRIGKASVSVGNVVGPSSGGLAELINLDPIYVRFHLSDRDLLEHRRLKLEGKGHKATPYLRLDDGSRYAHVGRFTFIDNRVDPKTDTIAVRAEFPNPDKLLLPDQFVTVLVERSQPVSALVVPQAAIQEDQTGRFVLVVDKDNRVQVRQVALGEQEGTDWVVNSGLDAGERIIVQGLQKVRPGVTVRPVAAGKAPGGIKTAPATPAKSGDVKPGQG